MNILIVEDEAIARSALASLLSAQGYQTSVVGSAEAALDRLKGGWHPAVALVDVDLPGMNGLELIRRLLADRPDVQPVLITAETYEAIQRRVTEPIPYLRKPLDFERLLHLLHDHEATAH